MAGLFVQFLINLFLYIMFFMCKGEQSYYQPSLFKYSSQIINHINNYIKKTRLAGYDRRPRRCAKKNTTFTRSEENPSLVWDRREDFFQSADKLCLLRAINPPRRGFELWPAGASCSARPTAQAKVMLNNYIIVTILSI